MLFVRNQLKGLFRTLTKKIQEKHSVWLTPWSSRFRLCPCHHVCGPLVCLCGSLLSSVQHDHPHSPENQRAVLTRGCPQQRDGPFSTMNLKEPPSLASWPLGPKPQACQPYLMSPEHVWRLLRMTGGEFHPLPMAGEIQVLSVVLGTCSKSASLDLLLTPPSPCLQDRGVPVFP